MKLLTVAQGFSLTELLFVLAVTGVVAAVAVPTFSNPAEQRVQLAASQVSEALRHARIRAVATGVPHGVRKVAGSNSIAVFRADLSKDPPIEVYDVPHPQFPQRLYMVDLANSSPTRGTAVAAYVQTFDDLASHEAISFNARGEPVNISTGKLVNQSNGVFLVSNNQRVMQVTVQHLTGRLTTGEQTLMVILPDPDPGPIPLPPTF